MPSVSSSGHDFATLTENVRNLISGNSFKIRVGLREAGVVYKNELASFVDANTIVSSSKSNLIDNFLGTGNLPDDENLTLTSKIIRIQKGRHCSRRKASNAVRARVQGR